MKRSIVFVFLIMSFISTALLAEEDTTDFYFGLDVFTGETDYDVDKSGIYPLWQPGRDEDLDQDGFRVKLGARLEDEWRLQGYFQYEDIETLNNKIYALGFDVIKGFRVTPKFKPFVLVGVGLHWREAEDELYVRYDDDSFTAVSAKIGVGAAYELNETFELVGGFDLQYRSWADMDVIEIQPSNTYAYTLEQEDVSKTFYIGVNAYF